LGLGDGDVCMISSRRGLSFWVDVVATWSIGAVVAPVDGGAAETSRADLIAIAHPRALLGIRGDRMLGGETSQLVAEGTAALLFTSGSTGRQKAVELSAKAIIGNVDATCAALPMDAGTRLAMAIPFHFTSAICHFLAATTRGAALVTTERPMLPRDFVQFVTRGGADAVGGAPLQMAWLAEGGGDLGRTLRWVMSSGDHLPVPTIRRIREALPEADVFTVYGLTEAGGRLCVLPPRLIDTHAGSVGFPIAGMSIVVRDEEGRELEPEVDGEVYFSGPYVATGYYGDPAESTRAFTSVGFRTGDIGRRGEDGVLWLSGRSDDVFKVSGHKVSAVAIASALQELGFVDAAVLPVDDPVAGSAAHAFVVCAPGTSLDVPRTLASLRELVPAMHVPRRITAVESIPRTGSGKLVRQTLRDLAVVRQPRTSD
jgi:long-chain acyl-CoA synthetase